MQIPHYPFIATNWAEIPAEVISGETGTVSEKCIFVGDIRIRMLDFSAGYLADHWCKKGHIIHCIEGEIQIIFEDGKETTLFPGMTFIVGDESSSHRTKAKNGCRLFITD